MTAAISSPREPISKSIAFFFLTAVQYGLGGCETGHPSTVYLYLCTILLMIKKIKLKKEQKIYFTLFIVCNHLAVFKLLSRRFSSNDTVVTSVS